MEDVLWLDATAQAGLVASGEVTARELAEAAMARIEKLDGSVNAVIHRRFERALDEIEAGLPPGPFRGVPFLIKDLFADSAGDPAHQGNRALKDAGWTARQDSWLVARLRAAGFAFLGRTNTPEFGLVPVTEPHAYGPCRNPWDLSRSPGGSSGGSAAAVAAGLAAGALGSDGGCSLRVPAAFCGIVGLKPQRGRVPLARPGTHWHGMTVFGPLGRTVADVALLFDVLRGAPAAPVAAPGRLRVALSWRPAAPARVHPAHREAVERVGERLAALGHAVQQRDPDYGVLPPDLLPRYHAGVAAEAATLPHPERLERRTRTNVRIGRAARGALLRRALAREAAVSRRLNGLFADADVLVTPVTAQPAPAADVSEGHGALRTFADQLPHAAFTGPWSGTGQPALSLPAGFGDDGLPLAVQLVGPPDSEARLLGLAAQLEAAHPWADRLPPL